MKIRTHEDVFYYGLMQLCYFSVTRRQLCKGMMGEDWLKGYRAEKMWRVTGEVCQYRHEVLKRGFCSPGMVKISEGLRDNDQVSRMY